MKNILVALDGSDNARTALNFAIETAASSGASVSLIYVDDGHTLSDSEKHLVETEFGETLRHYSETVAPKAVAWIPETGVFGVMRQQQQHANAIRQILGDGILNAAKAQAGRAGVKVPDTIYVGGDPANEIIRAAGRIGADMIAVGSRGLGGFSGAILGSVSQKVANLSSVSVVIAK